jgi:hypothetical protein
MKSISNAKMREGTEAWTRFETAMKKVLSVPHSEIKLKIEEHRKESALNPNRRGPKPKRIVVTSIAAKF